MQYVVGVDEVGRGPVAGPVTVGVVCVHKDFDMSFFEGIPDSKKLSHQKRQQWKEKIFAVPEIKFQIASISANMIDRIGINKAITKAMEQALRCLEVDPDSCHVLLDGGLRAPAEFISQQTIIKGDEKEPLIAIASILAKEHRDEKMEKLAVRFKEYGFEKHKGYGTPEHLRTIKKFGLSRVHRATFLRRAK